MSKKLIIANWKMNPATTKEARALFDAIRRKVDSLKRSVVVIVPPVIFLPFFKPSKKILLGAQDVGWAEKGAYTGEISAPQLSSLNVSYVIVGHSERRALGETDEMISKKIKSALKHAITPVLCVGERERDQHGVYLRIIEDQIRKSLTGIGRPSIEKIIIAYEPVWAIGKTADDAMDSHKLHEMTIFIKKILSSLFGREVAHRVRIIYGGSVEEKNALELMTHGNVVGFLVGHASLEPKRFSEIMNSADHA